MAKKKTVAPKSRKTSQIQPEEKSFFMGLTKTQTQSLAVGIIVAGIGLFALAGIAYNKRHTITESILPDGAATMLSRFEITPTPTELTINGNVATPSSAMQTAKETPTEEVTPTVVTTAAPMMPAATSAGTLISKLPNTSSKVTYTVKEDDSLATIGQTLCESESAWLSIVATNNILYPDTIYPGQTYIITCH